MPPHCDTSDGPVVTEALRALDEEDVNIILPWAYKKAEEEIKGAFVKALEARKNGSKELADRWFCETVVRLHREGEGAPYTGLKPAGLEHGPVLPYTEKAIETGDAGPLVEFLQKVLQEEVQKRLDKALSLKDCDPDDVDARREYIEAMLAFMLFSHHLWEHMTGEHIH